MALWMIRALFIMAGSAAAYSIGVDIGKAFICLAVGIAACLILVLAEWFLSRGPVALISSLAFGLLIGMLFAVYAQKIILLAVGDIPSDFGEHGLILGLLVVFIYLAVAFIYSTRDKFHILIPYIEFRKEQRGARPVLLDTSVIIDGRVAGILRTGALDAPIIIPETVLQELHHIADSEDRLRRDRGRLGLDSLNEIQQDASLDVRIQDFGAGKSEVVDQQLISAAKKMNARIMTNDYNLNRLASVEGIDVVNLNQLANALKPIALPDEVITTKLIKRGEQVGQAVGYLEDGTMVVVENAMHLLGKEVDVLVTNTITRDTGRMIFGRPADRDRADGPRGRS